ncbi:phosphoribosylamine--glycine ligase [Salibacter halophilus]|uniref:Phosphoribosylamine--glycine ligase n=1 Tax=Salibacter halophilus TaxID=1803916 RepID=A0A6N6M4X6_9FLAO|nr:phosphoribosylamine--glycine ligase [Salibacter halophilus]KAB1063196.1 phosphoribosylamine--glycine ligase [Salibacter halophilus]
MNVLVIGSGGREHTLGWAVKKSPKVDNVIFAPGNAGTMEIGQNLDVAPTDFEGLKKAVLDNNIEMVVVGPEAPLVEGVVDFFKADEKLKNVAIIGPGKEGAQLEGSKDFSKEFMQRNQIPTARYKTVDKSTIDEGKNFLSSLNPPFVLKADGLAAGKGVLIVKELEEACEQLENMLDGKFGEASEKVVIEEFLDGIELSVFVLSDGKDFVLLPEAKDYKRIGEGDTGLNTGGMGAVSPVPFADDQFLEKVKNRIIIPTIDGLRIEGIDYKGFIFVGLMNVGGDPYVVEYNARLGDPETEAILPRVKTDLVELFEAVNGQNLGEMTCEIDDKAAVSVVLVSGGYPEKYEKGKVISGLEEDGDELIFHAGTKRDGDDVLTAGGRVIAVTALEKSTEKALQKAMERAEKINFDKKYYRTDIGKDLL